MYVCSHEHFMISSTLVFAGGEASAVRKSPICIFQHIYPYAFTHMHVPICIYPYACTHMHVPICIIPGEGMHASFRGRESKCSKEQVQ